MIAVFFDNPLASIAALFGAACAIAWPFFRTRRMMLVVQVRITLGFGLHYALLGAGSAAVANLLSGLQLLAFLQASRTACFNKVGYLLIPVMVLISVLTWTGVPSLCAVSGTVLLAIGRMQADEERLRIWVMAGTVPWLFHDLLMGSPIAVIDAISRRLKDWIYRSRAAAPRSNEFPRTVTAVRQACDPETSG